MDLKELYEMQAKLDNVIVNKVAGGNPYVDHEWFLVDRLLALQVEVSELANATRCFKYWSQKGPESKEKLLEEHADILFFWLSVGLALGFTVEEMEKAYLDKYEVNLERQRNGY